MTCPECKAEFVEGIYTCPDCGIPLVYRIEEDVSPNPEAEDTANFVLVYYPINSQEVALIKMILEREDIPYYIKNEPLYKAVLYSIQGPGNIELYVAEEYADDIIELLKNELGHD